MLWYVFGIICPDFAAPLTGFPYLPDTEKPPCFVKNRTAERYFGLKDYSFTPPSATPLMINLLSMK